MTRQEAIDALLDAIEFKTAFMASSEPLFHGMAEAYETTQERVKFLVEQEMQKISLDKNVSPEVFKDFSDEELVTLAEFHSSPLGKKAMELMPTIIDEMVGDTVDIIEDVLDNVLERLESRPTLSVVK